MKTKSYYVYILTNSKRTTLYIGMTNDLKRRLYEHQQGLVDGFSQKYKLKHIVYYEQTNDVQSAIAREKQLKNWHREWKINLIKQQNPMLKDLDAEINSA